jgi:DNA-binding IclR family transcriptional regulator
MRGRCSLASQERGTPDDEQAPLTAEPGQDPGYARAPVVGASSPAVVNAFRLLDVLMQRPNGARLSDLARDLGLPKSSALRLLGTMCQIGVVRRQHATGNYQTGTRLLDYAKAPLDFDMDLVREFYRVAEPMHAELNETIQLAVLSAADVMFIARIDSTKAVRLVTEIGRRLPAHATGVGKAILAFSDPADVDRIIAAGLPKLTANTITDPVAFRAELDRARQNGFATESEESSPNLSCLSAPVLGPDGLARAGMTVCVPVSRLTPEQSAPLAQAVRSCAQALTAAL